MKPIGLRKTRKQPLQRHTKTGKSPSSRRGSRKGTSKRLPTRPTAGRRKRSPSHGTKPKHPEKRPRRKTPPRHKPQRTHNQGNQRRTHKIRRRKPPRTEDCSGKTECPDDGGNSGKRKDHPQRKAGTVFPETGIKGWYHLR